MADNTRPFQQGQPPTQEQFEAFGKLARILKGGQQEYTPIMKALQAINVDYKIVDVMLGDEPTECLVIPLKDLMYREWCHISGQNMQPQGEEQ